MKKLRQTSHSYWLGIIRIMLGIIFLMTGIMKLTFAEFGSAWSIQLIDAEIPFYAINFWLVPVFEFILGIILLTGYYSRIGAVLILPIMTVAIYVHISVSNPAAFPAQPQEPIIPIAVIIMAVIVLIKGGGYWSLDFKATENSKT